MKVITRFFRKKQPPKEKLMQHFSHEFLEKLINEHKLVSASLGRLQNSSTHNEKMRVHGVDACALAVTNLKARKVELEVMIDVLSEFLNS